MATPLAQRLHLGGPWEPLLQKLVVETCDDAPSWRRRLILATEPITVQQLRVIALAMRGVSTAQIHARTPGSARISRHEVESLALAVALRYTSDDAGWDFPKPGTSARRLVEEGLPAPQPDAPHTHQFAELWARGLPLEEIRGQLGITVAATRRLATAATPPRWNGIDIAAHFGWSRENHRLKLARGHFPAPDGREGVIAWWWPITITRWAQIQDFTTCPDCGAKVQRLSQHQVKHTRARP